MCTPAPHSLALPLSFSTPAAIKPQPRSEEEAHLTWNPHIHTLRNITIRLATDADIPTLASIERSAGQLFKTVPSLAHVADSPTIPPTFLEACITKGHVWIASVSGTPSAPSSVDSPAPSPTGPPQSCQLPSQPHATTTPDGPTTLDTIPIAFLAGRPLDSSFFICEISVALPFQRRGLGSVLLSSVYSDAWAMGFRRISLTTYREPPWNRPWYERKGFVVCCAEMLGEGHAEVVKREERAVLSGFESGKGERSGVRCCMVKELGDYGQVGCGG